MKNVIFNAGTEIKILPEWQDAGDSEYRWFAAEDALEGHSLRIRAEHPDPEHSSHKMRFKPMHLVHLHMIEVIQK